MYCNILFGFTHVFEQICLLYYAKLFMNKIKYKKNKRYDEEK